MSSVGHRGWPSIRPDAPSSTAVTNHVGVCAASWKVDYVCPSSIRGGGDLSSLKGTQSALSFKFLPVASFQDLLTCFYVVMLSHQTLAFWSRNSPWRVRWWASSRTHCKHSPPWRSWLARVTALREVARGTVRLVYAAYRGPRPQQKQGSGS